jgi:hypothetical protein
MKIGAAMLGRTAFVAAMILAAGPGAVADPIPIACHLCQITSGNVSQGLNTMPGLTLIGPEFPGLNLEHASLTLADWFDWKPGELLDVTIAASGFEGYGDVLPEPGFVSGFDVSMRFVGPEPRFTGQAPPWEGPNVGYAAPFKMTGRITGPDFDRLFFGSGNAQLWWAADGTRASYAKFFFAEPAVPEPGTMLLFASGLGLLIGRARWTSNRTQ